MFSTRERLEKRTGPFGVARLSYLQSLVNEYQETDSEDSKLQILANLANFSYDPINFEYIRKLNIIDLFLDCLEESNDKLVEFAVGGLCNMANDKCNQDLILSNDGVNLLVRCLSSSNEETVLSAITTMLFLFTPTSKIELTSIAIVDAMLRFSKSNNTRLRNLASIYLREVHSHQLKQAIDRQKLWSSQVQSNITTEITIPLPSVKPMI